jgi:tetratricopeptide (TPR) repeat protein
LKTRFLLARLALLLSLSPAFVLAKPAAKPAAKPVDPPLDEKARALQHVEAAVKLYGQSKYRDAIAEYQLALDEYPSAPGPYRDIGRCYRDLKEFSSAISYLTEYLLRASPTAEDRALVEEVLSQTKADYITQRSPRQLSVQSAPTGALVYAQDERGTSFTLGKTPLERVPLPPQTKELRVSHPEYPVQLIALGASQQEVAVDFVKRPSQARSKTPGRIFLALGGSSALAGAALGVLFLQERQALNNDVAAGNLPVEEFEARTIALRRSAILTDALTVSAIGCGITGILLLKRSKAPQEGAALRLGPTGATFVASF